MPSFAVVQSSGARSCILLCHRLLTECLTFQMRPEAFGFWHGVARLAPYSAPDYSTAQQVVDDDVGARHRSLLVTTTGARRRRRRPVAVGGRRRPGHVRTCDGDDVNPAAVGVTRRSIVVVVYGVWCAVDCRRRRIVFASARRRPSRCAVSRAKITWVDREGRAVTARCRLGIVLELHTHRATGSFVVFCCSVVLHRLHTHYLQVSVAAVHLPSSKSTSPVVEFDARFTLGNGELLDRSFQS